MELSRMFEADIAVPAVDQRLPVRRLVNFAASVRDAGVTAAKVRVTDLSTDGCRIVGCGSVDPGTEIWIKISGLAALRAEVIWSDEKGTGCRFPVPIDLAVVEQLSQEARPKTRGIFGRAPNAG